MKNKYCDSRDLRNEASVESCFVNRLLRDIGYRDSDIDFKTAIQEHAVGKGAKKVLYKPDYILKTNGIPTVVIDAKGPEEDITKWEFQCSAYCLELNKLFDYNPVQHYVITNGLLLNLYKWDVKAPILSCSFADFTKDNNNFEQLLQVIGRDATRDFALKAKEDIDLEPFSFAPIGLKALTDKFQKLHKYIWRTEKKGPSAAFQELMKIVFVKIQKDRQLHDALGPNPKPKYKDVVFSHHWISSQSENESPVNDPLFKNLITSLEKEIKKGKRKRIFEINEQINASPETIKRVVRDIENIDFCAMEEDVHGRMFEAFLDATVRGKDIGQFFTPRDVVDVMVGMADVYVGKNKVDTILDACCGSGGFLISAMRVMLGKIDKMSGLSSEERQTIRQKITNKSLYGIDAGSDPAMYKIARMNMYLHGDGGSNIYYADSLDKKIGKVGSSGVEVDQQIEEVRKILLTEKKHFDIILSNPPFSMQYTRDDADQAEILNQYDVAVDRAGGRILNKLLSSVMFIERYRDLVAENGKIFAIIDDSVLSGDSYKHVRIYIKNNFIIHGIVSLPGDAFRRASARVKTSIIILRPKKKNEAQRDIFMTSAIYLGVEEKTAKRIGINPATLTQEKAKEKKRIIQDYHSYLNGKGGDYVVPIENLSSRFDVKYCINDRGRKRKIWAKKRFSITTVGAVLKSQSGRSVPVEEDEEYQFLRVTYNGDIIDGDLILGDSCSYNKLYKVKTWDVLVSNIGVGRGAIAVVPPYHSDKYVSNEYTILRAKSKEEAVYYSNLLRTKEILGDILSSTTGMNRGRIKWNIIANVAVPEYVSGDHEITALVSEMEQFWENYKIFLTRQKAHIFKLENELDVAGEDAHKRWLAFKPPE